MRFTSLTDCYILRFILTYDYAGSNPVLLRLQMRFILCAVDIYHCPGSLMRPDYLSRLGANLCVDELTCKYLNSTTNLRKLHSLATGTMLPENMNGYRGSIVRSTLPVDPCIHVAFGASNPPAFELDSSIAPVLSAIKPDFSGGHHFSVQTYPIMMGYLTPADQKTCRDVTLYNHATSMLVALIDPLQTRIVGNLWSQ